MNTLLLLAALLGQTFPTNDNRPGGAVNMTGCASWSDGYQLCCPVGGPCQLLNSVGGGAALQLTSIDTTTAGTLTVGGTNATGVQVGNASAPVTIYGGVSVTGHISTTGNANVVAANAVTISALHGPSQALSLQAATGAVALTFANYAANDSITLRITQHDATGGGVQNITTWSNGGVSVTFGNGVAPTITATASAVDVISCTFASGTVADCFVAGQAMTAVP